MSDQDWAERFSRDLDSILAGEKVSGEYPSDEYGQLIELAVRMIGLDLGGDLGSRRDIKERILRRIQERKENDSGELGEEDLDKVAGGLRTIIRQDL